MDNKDLINAIKNSKIIQKSLEFNANLIEEVFEDLKMIYQDNWISKDMKELIIAVIEFTIAKLSESKIPEVHTTLGRKE